MENKNHSRSFITCQINACTEGIKEYRKLSVDYPSNKNIHIARIKDLSEQRKNWKKLLRTN